MIYKPIRVFLSGGLGNQLFQWVQGLQIESVLNRQVVFDVSLLDKYRVPRLFELGSLVGNKVVVSSFPLIKYLPAVRHIPLQRYVLVGDGNFPLNLKEISHATWGVVGYFQSVSLVDEMKSEIRNRFANSTEFNTLLPKAPVPRICIHIRRGDLVYDKTAKEFHGLSNDDYFLQAAKRLREINGLSNVLIVSDGDHESLENIRRKLMESKFEVSFGPTNNGSIEDLALIANSSGIVTSNSSYSWWGAWLASRFSSATVIMPTPWFAQPRSDEKLLYSSEWLIHHREIG